METLQRSLAELAGTTTCHYCHAPLGEERAVANTREGPRWFLQVRPRASLGQLLSAVEEDARMKTRCDTCGGPFGLIRQKWLGYHFCCEACMEDWMAKRQRALQSFKQWIHGTRSEEHTS